MTSGADQRMIDAASRARSAELHGEDGTAAAEWRRYRLIRDAARNPDDLLAEGVALSVTAVELAASS